MNKDIKSFNQSQSDIDQQICQKLAEIIDENLNDTQSKIWYAHPVWFIDGNPIVGYSKL